MYCNNAAIFCNAIFQPSRISSTHYSSTQDSQEQWLSRDREDESCDEGSSQEDVEWDVSHIDTLWRYKINYSEHEEDFQKVFENMQVLRNTMTNSSTRNDRYSKDVETAILNLLTICNDIHASTGTVASKNLSPRLSGENRSSPTVTKVRSKLFQRFLRDWR